MERTEHLITLKGKEKEEANIVETLLVRYEEKFCEFPGIISIIIPLIFLPFFFLIHSIMPYKQMIELDKINNILLIYYRSLIPCCKLEPKIYNLKDIEKIRIYIYSKPDPYVGFNKLYFINCEIYSKRGETEKLFSGVEYDKETFERLTSFFNKHFNTEIEPIEVAKDISELNIIGENNN